MYTVVEDVMANDYVAGEGVNFFSKASFESRWNDQEIGRKEMSESLIAFSLGREVRDRATTMDWLPWTILDSLMAWRQQ